ncbi:PspA/IM30 family protein [Microcoleus sp. FACHB-1515]|uniref:PspA/IM30 family protein n=1 Tax=Cyanophyceae TaxID=3028117 RepID=UPI001683A863|nr:PspA/IM30 family protein [Microcoleus sp. FACHB-1515]MBD2093525.1 PspA/IM30 family protein [Microcoleus sp. FACHB-1515]
MGLYDRASRVVKSELTYRQSRNISSISAEQSLQEFNGCVSDLKKSLDSAKLKLKRLQGEYDRALAQASKWKKRVGLANQHNRADLSEAATVHFQIHRQEAIDLKIEIGQQNSIIFSLKQSLESLNTDVDQEYSCPSHSKEDELFA